MPQNIRAVPYGGVAKEYVDNLPATKLYLHHIKGPTFYQSCDLYLITTSSVAFGSLQEVSQKFGLCLTAYVTGGGLNGYYEEVVSTTYTSDKFYLFLCHTDINNNLTFSGYNISIAYPIADEVTRL